MKNSQYLLLSVLMMIGGQTFISETIKMNPIQKKQAPAYASKVLCGQPNCPHDPDSSDDED